MPIHKESLSKVTINQLEELTGCSYRTIKKRLRSLEPESVDGRSIYFDPKRALPLILGIGAEGDGDENAEILDLRLQQARFSKARADKTEIEIKILKKQLIPAEQIEQELSDVVMAFRSKVLSIPSRATLQVVGLKDPLEIENKIRDMVYEALYELSDYGSDEPAPKRRRKKSSKAGRTAT